MDDQERDDASYGTILARPVMIDVDNVSMPPAPTPSSMAVDPFPVVDVGAIDELRKKLGELKLKPGNFVVVPDADLHRRRQELLRDIRWAIGFAIMACALLLIVFGPRG